MAVAVGVVDEGTALVFHGVVEKGGSFGDDFGFVCSTSRTVPASTASGRSVTSRLTRMGLAREGPSSWTPPESVMIR